MVTWDVISPETKMAYILRTRQFGIGYRALHTWDTSRLDRRGYIDSKPGEHDGRTRSATMSEADPP